ncbi:MAG: hypothetical protein ABIJ21_02580 [Nanoarchaeota archaeon]
MGGSFRSGVYKDVVEALRTGSGNVHQIAEAKGLNWKTVKIALDSLVAAGLVQLEDKKYSLRQQIVFNEDTLLNLPLTTEQNKQFCELANRIQELSKKKLNRTFLQKAVVEVIKRDKIQTLPYGWYIYGECCVHKLDDSTLRQFGSNKDHDSTIKEILHEFSQYENTDVLMKILYEKENNELYLHKFSVILLLKHPFTDNAVSLLKNELTQILFSLARRKSSDMVYNWFDAFSSAFTMLSKLPIEELENNRMDIIEAFNTIWNLIGISNFRSVEKYYEQSVDIFFQMREQALLDTLEIQLSKLRDLWPEIKLDPKMEATRRRLIKSSGAA